MSKFMSVPALIDELVDEAQNDAKTAKERADRRMSNANFLLGRSRYWKIPKIDRPEKAVKPGRYFMIPILEDDEK